MTRPFVLALFLIGLLAGVGSVFGPQTLLGVRDLADRVGGRAAPGKAAGGPAARPAEPPREPPLHVLFLGNSYTNSNAMPRMIGELARADGQRPFEFVADTPGGAGLQEHVAGRRYTQHMASHDFAYVVLQDQSQRPSFGAKLRETRVYQPARILHDAIRHGAARTLLFVTWARRDGDPMNRAEDSYEAMQQRVNRGYRLLADELGAQLAPVGSVWQAVHESRPGLRLWQPDGSHPTRAGSYLAACVLYSAMYGRPVEGNPFVAGLDAADALHVQRAADRALSVHAGAGGQDPPAAEPAGVEVPIVVPGILLEPARGCDPAYVTVEGLCYHRALGDDPAKQRRLIDAYRAGAVPPLVR